MAIAALMYQVSESMLQSILSYATLEIEREKGEHCPSKSPSDVVRGKGRPQSDENRFWQ